MRLCADEEMREIDKFMNRRELSWIRDLIGSPIRRRRRRTEKTQPEDDDADNDWR